jgi:glycosyltransferase involved in cell wall biosynthesis
MRIVVATPLFPPEIGGPATYANILLEGLSKVAGQGLPPFEVEVVKFSDVRMYPKFFRHYVYYRRIRKALRFADMVLALDPVSVGLPALFASKKEGKPFAVKIVGDYAWEQGQQRFGITETLDAFVERQEVPCFVRVLRSIQTYVAREAVQIIVPSQYLKSIVTKWDTRIVNTKIAVIYNAMICTTSGVVPEDVKALPRPRIVTAGRLVPWKHIEGVIDAVAQVPQASLVIVGGGDEQDMLVRRASVLADRCVFTGVLSHADTLAVVQSADVFVLNSSYEGLSHLLIEASMLGVPSVATRIGGNPEVIIDGETGLLVESGDTFALTHALQTILSDEGLRARLSARATESSTRFSADTMLSKVADTLAHL